MTRYRHCGRCRRRRRFIVSIEKQETFKVTRRWTCSKGHYFLRESPTVEGITQMMKDIYAAECKMWASTENALWRILQRRR